MKENYMDNEDFLSEIYTPLKAIEALSKIIYYKSQEEWCLFLNNTKRSYLEEFLGLNYAIELCAKDLLKMRKRQLKKLFNPKLP